MAVALAVLATGVGGRPAAADASGSADAVARIALEGCADVDAAEVHRLVAIELRAPVLPATDPKGATPALPTVHAVCDRDRITLGLADTVTRKRVERTVDLTSTPPIAKTRVIALEIAELFLASWAELMLKDGEEAPTPANRPPSAKRAATAVERRARRPERVRLRLFGVGRFFVNEASTWPAAGVALAIEGRITARLRWTLATTFDRGFARADLGKIEVDLTGLGVGVLTTFPLSSWAFVAGIDLRGWLVRLEGDPFTPEAFEGRTMTSHAFGTAAKLGVDLPAVGRFVSGVLLEVGYVLTPVVGFRSAQGVEARAFAVEGVFVGAMLGAGMGF